MKLRRIWTPVDGLSRRTTGPVARDLVEIAGVRAADLDRGGAGLHEDRLQAVARRSACGAEPASLDGGAAEDRHARRVAREEVLPAAGVDRGRAVDLDAGVVAEPCAVDEVGADVAAGDRDDRAGADLDPRAVAPVPERQRELRDGARERALEVEAVESAGPAAVELDGRAGAVDRRRVRDLR